jgi:predicted transcriptional regulator
MMLGGRLRSFLNRVETWFTQAQATSADDQLQPPPEWVSLLVDQEIDQLLPPDGYTHAIRTQVETALNQWQTQLEAENCLVWLGSPVDDIERALRQSLTDWQPQTPLAIHLQWPPSPLSRCRDPLAIPAQLHNWYEPRQGEAEATESETDAVSDETASLDSLESRHTVVIIPALEQYFLRCIQGWEGIEYLQHLITQDRSRFWIIGCNAWAWAFLDRVCRINAYLEQVERLPRLDGAALQDWLRSLAAPLLHTNVEADEASPTPAKEEAQPDAPPAQATDAEPQAETASAPATTIGSESYWNALASLSSGIGTTAALLWRRSLRLRAETLTEHFQSLDSGTIQSVQDLCDAVKVEFELIKPTLPGLINLEVLDRYLLHSLLIHGPMSRDHLAQSLGETERLVRSRVQVLKRAGVIVPRQGKLAVSAIHYPKLRSELSNNNFLIGEV